MRKINYIRFRKINIYKDLPIKFTNGIYGGNIKNILQELRIETLEELFEAYDEGIFKDETRKYNQQINGEINLISSYYLGKLLPGDEILKQDIFIKSTPNINKFFLEGSTNKRITKIGINFDEKMILYNYCFDKRNQIVASPLGYISFINLLILFQNDKSYHAGLISGQKGNQGDKNIDLIQNLIFKINYYLKYLNEKSLLKELGDINIINSLQNQLDDLLNTRDNLDSQIELLQNQLDNINKAKDIKKRIRKK